MKPPGPSQSGPEPLNEVARRRPGLVCSPQGCPSGRTCAGWLVSRPDLFLGALEQRLHIADRVGGAQAWIVSHPGDVIGDDDAAEADLLERLHDLVHILVAIVYEGLDEVGQGCGHVAEVDLEELLLSGEVADRLDDIDPPAISAFEPAADAETDADVGAVGDRQGALVALEGAEDSGHAAQSGDWWII